MGAHVEDRPGSGHVPRLRLGAPPTPTKRPGDHLEPPNLTDFRVKPYGQKLTCNDPPRRIVTLADQAALGRCGCNSAYLERRRGGTAGPLDVRSYQSLSFRSRHTPPERSSSKPVPLRASSNPLNYRASKIRTGMGYLYTIMTHAGQTRNNEARRPPPVPALCVDLGSPFGYALLAAFSHASY